MKRIIMLVLIVVFSQLLFAQYVMEWQSPYGYSLAADDDNFPRDLTMYGEAIVVADEDETSGINSYYVYDIDTFELIWSYQTIMWFLSFAYITDNDLPEVIFYHEEENGVVYPTTVAIVSMTTSEEVIIVDQEEGVYPIPFISGFAHDKLILQYYAPDDDRREPLYVEVWGDGSSSTTNNVVPNIGANLRQNFPNPFNPSTTINYSLKKSGNVELSIYNVKGQLVDTIVNEYQNIDDYSIVWNSSKISSGMYFYQISIDGNQTEAKKAICIK